MAQVVGDVAGAVRVLACDGGNATMGGGGVGAAAGFPVWASMATVLPSACCSWLSSSWWWGSAGGSRPCKTGVTGKSLFFTNLPVH